MLEYYLDSAFKRRRFRRPSAGLHMDHSTDWLLYARRGTHAERHSLSRVVRHNLRIGSDS